MKITNAKPSSLTVLGLGFVALLLVLTSTGGAVAGALITGKQIKDGTITSADVKNRTLKAADLSPRTLKALAGKQGVPGLQGPPGATGPAGPPGRDGVAGRDGADGLSHTVVRSAAGSELTSGAGITVNVNCHDDEWAISGGVQAFGGTTPASAIVSRNHPITASAAPYVSGGQKLQLGGGWTGRVENLNSIGKVNVAVWVLCAKAG